MNVWPVAVYLLVPYALLSLAWRALRYPPYWRHWPERFGFVTVRSDRPVIWVHAVSVGEVRSSAGLIDALAARYPRHRIWVTTMTPTGAEQVRRLFADRVTHSYVPFDFPDAVSRFLDRVNPSFAVIAETEFWPNIFAGCRRRGIPLYLVNVRMSQASYSGYRWVGGTVRRMLDSADLICAQSRLDAQRLRNLGVDGHSIRITGNLKFDVELPHGLLEEGAALRQQIGANRPVWIAASTHRGEEALMLDAHESLRQSFPDLLLVLVPRHPERFEAVVRLCRRRGFDYARRSEWAGDLPDDVDVLVGDTMGELQRLYAAADVAFVGGSLVPKGGQNLLEASAVAVPVVFGPHMFHFEEISAMALERGAAMQVNDADDLAEAVGQYLSQSALRQAAGRAAHSLIDDNRGSLARTLDLLSDRLPRTGRAEDVDSAEAESPRSRRA